MVVSGAQAGDERHPAHCTHWVRVAVREIHVLRIKVGVKRRHDVAVPRLRALHQGVGHCDLAAGPVQ